MFGLATCRRDATCSVCTGTIPAGQEPAIEEPTRLSARRLDRYCRDCAFTRFRPLVAAEVGRLRALEEHVLAVQPAARVSDG